MSSDRELQLREHALRELAGCLAMAARYAENRHTGVINDVRRAYRAWAATQDDPEARPPYCNEDDHAVLLGRHETTWDAFNERVNNA